MELSTKKLPYIARFHDKPDEEKLEELSASLTMLGIMAGDLNDTRNLVRLLKAVEDSPLQYFVSTLVLRSMKRAEYSAENEGHFGLAKRYYSHFTSPIRRYPDLISHRQLAALLLGERQPSKDELMAIAASSTATEYNAEMASRDLIEIKKYRYLEQLVSQEDKIGSHEFEAVIVRVAEFGVFVELPLFNITGMINMEPERLVEFKAGDEVSVRITDFEQMLEYDPSTGNMVHQEPYKIENGCLKSCILKPVLELA
jgi:ribonuclease R